jgi:propionate catabolism operon transcriptional regulator
MQPPNIAVIVHRSLTPLIRQAQHRYAGRANVLIYEEILDEAVLLADRLIAQQSADVILTGGANAAVLRESLRFPIATIKTTGFDLMRALTRAREHDGPVGLMAYGDLIPPLDELRQLFVFRIEQRSYRTAAQAHAAVQDLARRGCKVIVGSSLPVEYARREGLAHILFYSEDSVDQGIDEAIELGQLVQLGEARRERLSSIIHNLRDGLVAVDFAGKVLAMNPSFERLVGMSRDALSQAGTRALAGFSLAPASPGDTAELESVIEVGNQTMVMLRSPMYERGKHVGSVFALQESSTIQQSERRLIAYKQANNFQARHAFSAFEALSADIAATIALGKRYALTASTVLITGETGTGKEWFAQSMHAHSARRAGPFVPINCAAFPESLLESELFGHEEGAFTGSRKGGRPGLIELAHTGTLFLDEIGDMPLTLQTRLLRVLQEREVQRLGARHTSRVDIRVIAATHQSLETLIANGTFRQDLFFRLNVLRIELPPLRVRPNDVVALSRFLFRQVNGVDCAARGVQGSRSSRDAHEALLSMLLPWFRRYAWPGNIRELNNIVERLVAAEGTLEGADPPSLEWALRIVPELRRGAGEGGAEGARDGAVGDGGVDYEDAIRRYGSVAAAARMLKISRTTLWRRLREPACGRREN